MLGRPTAGSAALSARPRVGATVPAVRTVTVSGAALGVEDVVAVAHGQARAELAPTVEERMAASRAAVADAVARGAVVYGVTTGFGALADTYVGRDELAQAQLSLVRSHAAGVGEPLDDATVRALLLLRARTLAAGVSGVRVDLPQRLLDLLDAGLLPVVPEKGSVGASGDLAQLAHLALPLVGEGRLRRAGDSDPSGRPAAEVLAEHGLKPLTLAPKEGLALLNGTEPMQALLAFSVTDASLLVKIADLACALSVEALLGTDRPYDERVQRLRPHPGPLDSAANMRRLLAGSPLVASHRDSAHAVQDSYSLRCAPQVHGSARDVLGYARRVVEIELGSIVDNPVILDGDVATTGNFHGEPLAFAADMLAVAVAELGGVSERRTDRMLDPAFSRGLPPFLAPHPGTNSGYMIAQYTAAALVSENKVLAHPASVDSIPTSGNQEDHVSMGWTAVRKLRTVCANVRSVLAVELLVAAQGIDLRSSVAGPGPATGAAYERLRATVPTMPVDREVAPQIAAVEGMLAELVGAAESAAGPLG
ncbi:MAG: histidine ammonia-lyase [Acidothermales bacterium]|nr:histidine ammonia-lyase [Acidothermales bacterium]